ncbi:WD repeat-containing protein on Y chromosome-like [Arapaima gigas]
MPLERKVRPTSASGTLETQNVPSISNELGPGAGTAQQPWRKPIRLDTQGQKAPLDGLASFQPHDTADRGLFPEWLEQAILKKGHRSHSLALGEAATLTERHCSMDSMHSFYKLKVEQKVSLENLMKLKKAFEVNNYKADYGMDTFIHSNVISLH